MLPYSRCQGTARRVTKSAGLLSLLFVLACDSNAFDQAQVPVITITPLVAVQLLQFSWTPQGAQLVRVYKGATAGDGYGPDLMWSIAATGKNSVQSPMEYGTTSAPGATIDKAPTALVPGQFYTVQISRQDPKGNGSDGFTNTSNRYVGTQTFKVGSVPVP